MKVPLISEAPAAFRGFGGQCIGIVRLRFGSRRLRLLCFGVLEGGAGLRGRVGKAPNRPKALHGLVCWAPNP